MLKQLALARHSVVLDNLTTGFREQACHGELVVSDQRNIMKPLAISGLQESDCN